MVMSRAQKAAAITHILENVFDVETDSALHMAMQYNSIESPYSICQMSYQELVELQYPLDQKSLHYLPIGHAGRIMALKAYVEYQASIGIEIGEVDMMEITQSDYDNFRATKYLKIKGLLKLPEYKHGTTPNVQANFSGIKEMVPKSQLQANCILETAPKAPRTFLLAPNKTLKQRNISKPTKLQKAEHLTSPTQTLMHPSMHPSIHLELCKIDSVAKARTSHVLVVPSEPLSTCPPSLHLHTKTCHQKLCWGSQSENTSNASASSNFLNATSASEPSLDPSYIPLPKEETKLPSALIADYGHFVDMTSHLVPVLPFIDPAENTQKILPKSVVCMDMDLSSRNPRATGHPSQEPLNVVHLLSSEKLDHPSMNIMPYDGETSLDAIAMELDIFLYSTYGEYALDEVTIEMEPSSAYADDTTDWDKIDTSRLKTLVHELDTKLEKLAIQPDPQVEQMITSVAECNPEALKVVSSTFHGAPEVQDMEVSSPICAKVKPTAQLVFCTAPF